MNVFERFRSAVQVFRGRDHPLDHSTQQNYRYYGPTSYDRPDRLRMRAGNERTMVNSAYNRIALDVASVELHHARIDENDMYQEAIKDGLEEIMTVEANIDQSAQAYTMDLVMSLFDEGVVAEVPVDMDQDPSTGEIIDIYQLRTGKITEWMPQNVKINVYNEMTGRKEDVIMKKREVSIVENPFYSIMNERNSIFQRLTRKLNILDMVDENNGSDKMNMILQLPYVIRTDVRREEARARIAEIERQLKESKYGIAYTDGTEKVVQMNRPIENNLMKQIEWLTELFFSQLGITKEILNGTASADVMTNYMNRCVGPVLSAIALERKRKFLSPKRRKEGESIVFHLDPFKLVPVTSIANIADTLTRNAVLTPNEVRSLIGYKPVDSKDANALINRNMPVQDTANYAEDTEQPEKPMNETTS